MNIIDNMVHTLRSTGAWKATKFIGDKEIVRVTVIGKKLPKRGNHNYWVTIGRPNYEEREYIKSAKKAGELFQFKRLWLRYPPKKRK